MSDYARGVLTGALGALGVELAVLGVIVLVLWATGQLMEVDE